MKRNIIIPVFSLSLLILILAVSLLISSVSHFNTRSRSTTYSNASFGQTENDIGLKICPRGGPADTWIKQVDFKDKDGKIYSEQYAGITYDIVITNRTNYGVSDWTLSIPIRNSMYINNAWCGSLEIHQIQNSILSKQTIDLRKFTREADTVILDHLVSGSDILIPLSAGDTIIYHPSITEFEDFFYAPNYGEESSKTFGFIIYTKVDEKTKKPLDVPVFNQALFTYRLKSNIRNQNSFIIIVLLCAIWILTAVFAYYKSYRTALIEKRSKEQRHHDNQIIQQSMLAFIKFIDAKDSITKDHSVRVAEYSVKIAEAMGKSEEECENIYYIALMHDCGKIYIPDSILSKPGNLSEEEFKIMKTHAVKGAEILNQFTSIPNIIDGAVYHHERWDGKGYPRGLRGNEIPLVGRIICIADSFDAMNSRRSYKTKMSPEEIKKEIYGNLGKKFDPEIGMIFLDLLADGTIQF